MFRVMRSRIPSAMIYIIIFLAISALVTSQSTKDNKFEMNRLKVCVFDEDDTPESRALTEFIGKHNDIVEIDNNRDTITDSLYYKTVNYALIINKGYAERLAAGETAELFGSYHMDESYSVVYMSKMLDEYTGSVKAYLAMGKSLEEAVSATEAAMSQETEVEMFRVDKGGRLSLQRGLLAVLPVHALYTHLRYNQHSQPCSGDHEQEGHTLPHELLMPEKLKVHLPALFRKLPVRAVYMAHIHGCGSYLQ